MNIEIQYPLILLSRVYSILITNKNKNYLNQVFERWIKIMFFIINIYEHNWVRILKI